MFPSLQNKALLSVIQFFDNEFRVLFNKDKVNVFKGDTSILGTRDPKNGLYYIVLPTPTSPVRSEAHSAYGMMTKADLVHFLHRAVFSPVVLTWTKAIDAGYFTTWPGITSDLVRKHLPKSLKGTSQSNQKKCPVHKKFGAPPLHCQFLTLANPNSEATKSSSSPFKSLENFPPIKQDASL